MRTRTKPLQQRVWVGMFVMLLSGITLFSDLPARAYPLGQVSTATATALATDTATTAPSATTGPLSTATATPVPTSSQFGDVSISCRFYSDYDREFIVRLEVRPGGAPSGSALLTLVDGVTTQSDSFTSQTLSYRGPYLELSIQAAWPDGASGFAAATCGRIVPTNTPTPSDTPTASNTPLPTNTPTITPTPSRTRRPQPQEDTPTPVAEGGVPAPGSGGGPAPGSGGGDAGTPGPGTPGITPTLDPLAPTATVASTAPVTATPFATAQPSAGDRPVSLPNTGQPAPTAPTIWLLLASAALLSGLGLVLRRRLRGPLS